MHCFLSDGQKTTGIRFWWCYPNDSCDLALKGESYRVSTVSPVDRNGDRDGERFVAARFVTTAGFVNKMTKRAAMPARSVTNVVVTNRAGITPCFRLDISTCDIVSLCVCGGGGGGGGACLRAYVKEREKVTQRGRQNECVRQNEREEG